MVRGVDGKKGEAKVPGCTGARAEELRGGHAVHWVPW